MKLHVNNPTKVLICLLFSVFCLPVTAQTAENVAPPSPKIEDYPNYVPGTCGSVSMFQCNDGKCIEFTKVRDCKRDCSDNEDELCGLNQILCDEDVNKGSYKCGACIARDSAATLCLDRKYQRLCNVTGTIRCRKTANCVLEKWVNDGDNDCGDNSDEDLCFAGNVTCKSHANCSVDIRTNQATCVCEPPYYGDPENCIEDPLTRRIPGNCSSSPMEFDCGDKCIDVVKFHDCYRDCSDGSDEECWRGMIKCSDGCTCRRPHQLYLCPNISTGEKICQENGAIQCSGTNRCVYPEWLLDGKDNCGDWSDENACLHNKHNCSNEATCTAYPIFSNYTCTCRSPWVGDGRTCELAGSLSSVTVTATFSSFPDCVEGRFKCVTGACVPGDVVLDGTQDCSDGSDENYCTQYLYNCPSNEPCSYSPQHNNFSCGCPENTLRDSSGKCVADQNLPKSCADVATLNPGVNSGIFTIYKPNCVDINACSTEVWCDMETVDGGWTIIQQRSSDYSFWKNWQNYKAGFGDPERGDYWIGNDYLHQITNTPEKSYELLIEMRSKIDETVVVRYRDFKVGPESDNYRLTLGPMFKGKNDNMANARNQQFGTFDHDTDTFQSVGCGTFWESGWWFPPKCDRTGNLNVPHTKGANYEHLNGILWTGTPKESRMVTTKMFIKPTGFKAPKKVTTTPIPQRSGNQSQLAGICSQNFNCHLKLMIILSMILCCVM